MVYKCFWTYRQLQKVFFLIFFAWSVLSTVSKLLKSNAFDDLDGWLVISIIAGQFWNIKLLFRFQVSRFKTSRDFNYTMWQVNALHLYLSFHVIYSSKLLCEKEGNKLFCEYCLCVSHSPTYGTAGFFLLQYYIESFGSSSCTKCLKCNLTLVRWKA